MAQWILESRVTIEVDGNEISAQILQRVMENTAIAKAGGQVLIGLRALGTVLASTVKVTSADGQPESGPEFELNLMRKAND